MSLPANIDPAKPAGTDQVSAGDDDIRALKQFIVDILGLPTAPTNMTAAIMDVLADGTVLTPALIRLAAITTQKAILDGTVTWNNAGTTFKAILADITDTASQATSLLMDLQVGGVSKFQVGKQGSLGVNTAAPTVAGDLSISGKVAGGTVPHARTIVHSFVTGTTATTDLNLGTVSVGEIIEIFASVNFVVNTVNTVQGPSVGFQAGTAVIAMEPRIQDSRNVDANDQVIFSLSGIARVTTGGTLTIRSTILGNAPASINWNELGAIRHLV